MDGLFVQNNPYPYCCFSEKVCHNRLKPAISDLLCMQFSAHIIAKTYDPAMRITGKTCIQIPACINKIKLQ